MTCIICTKKLDDKKRNCKDVCSSCYNFLKTKHKASISDFLEQHRSANNNLGRGLVQ